MANNKYDAGSLTMLKGLEPVRQRPGMYIGSTDINGLHHLVWEIVDNAVDEANAGFGKNITVTIRNDGSLSVLDEGRGVPCDFNEKEHMSGFDMVYRTLHAGGKFDESNYKTAGGLHGVGGAVVNALSTYMEIHSYRDGVDHFIRFENGGSKESKIVETPIQGNKRGTLVTFMPDPTIFEDTNFDFTKIANSLDDRACLTKGVTFHLIDERSGRKQDFLYKDGIYEYFQTKNFGKNAIGEPIVIEGTSNNIKVQFVGQFFLDDYSEKISSFANGVRTTDGGHHVVGLKKALTVCFNNYALSHKLIKNNVHLEGEDIREGFQAILSCWVPETMLQFEGQTKSKLGTKEASIAVDDVIEQKLSYYLEEHAQVANKIIEKTLASLNARLKAKEARDSARKGSKVSSKDSNLSGKLSPASSKDYANNELFIVEGDSAGGSAKKCRDRMHQAILPLRGKPKNVVSATSEAEIFENKELNTIIYTIGAGCDDDFKIKDIKYGKVIIMTDADDDGCHIQNLLIAFFYEHMRPLIEQGHLYIACPPLYRLYNAKENIYCWTDEELVEARKKFSSKSKYTLSRFKGLGEMDAPVLGKTTMEKGSRKLIKVTIDDADECEDKVHLFMGKDADRRKTWIADNIDFSYHQDAFEEEKSHEVQK